MVRGPHTKQRGRLRYAALWTICLVSCLLTFAPSAEAHRPYFTRSEPVILPNGQTGEMRIIARDGIFAADPTRLLVLDSTGRLLARSKPYDFVDLVCPAAMLCYGYDLSSGNILEPDPATFLANGILIPALDQPRADSMWDVGEDDEAFGLRDRPATRWEQIRAEWQRLRRSPITIGYGLAVGLCAGLMFVGLKRSERTTKVAILSFLLRSLLFVALVCLVLLGFGVEVFVAPVPRAVIFLIAAATAAPHLLALVRRRLRSRDGRPA